MVYATFGRVEESINASDRASGITHDPTMNKFGGHYKDEYMSHLT